MSMLWVGIGSAALGAGASLYGANKQSKAIQSAASQDAASQAAQNQAAWANYLMTRGVNPAGAATGTIPTNPQAINARLPLWATANFKRPGAQTRWVKKGTATMPNTLSRGAPTPASGPPQDYSAGGDGGLRQLFAQ